MKQEKFFCPNCDEIVTNMKQKDDFGEWFNCPKCGHRISAFWAKKLYFEKRKVGQWKLKSIKNTQ